MLTTETKITTQSRFPDILDCIANLSSSEVFTPKTVVNNIIDNLPPEVWTNPDLKWLEPAPKTGIFLREITKRLMVSLTPSIPDPKHRIKHILTNMLYGLPTSEITALMSRRTLYTAKDPSLIINYSKSNTVQSLIQMDTNNGNLPYQRTEHTYKSEHCIYCGAKQGQYDGTDREGRENYAYSFIHNHQLLTTMKFDVIIGNPPYQIVDDGFGASAKPIYQLFVQMAISLNPKYISMIIPSRWFAGGKGLDEFRKQMLDDRRIKVLVDYPNANDCFPGVEIKGGVCYFLWDKSHKGECVVKTMTGDEITSEDTRSLGGQGVFIRQNEAISILAKVQKQQEPTLENKVSSQKPFGFRTFFDEFEAVTFENAVKIYARGRQGYLSRDKVVVNPQLIDKYKVLASKAYNGGDARPHQIIGKPIVTTPNSCCTMTYLVINTFETEAEATNMASYLRTKFVRFLISLKKNTQDLKQTKFAFVPDLDMNTLWTDEMLFQRYGLTDEEVAFIHSIVKEM